MFVFARAAVVLTSTLALAGCATVESWLMPDSSPALAATPAPMRENVPVAAAAPTAPTSATAPQLSDLETLNEQADRLSAAQDLGGADAGAYIRNAVSTVESGARLLETAFMQRRSSFGGLQDNITNSARAYLDVVSAVRSQLQIGATPGNPVLLRQLDQARAGLDALGSRTLNLRQLSNEIDRDLSQSVFLKQVGRNAQFIQGGTTADQERIQQALLRLDSTTRQMESLRDNVNRLTERQQGLEQIHRNELNMLTQIVYRGVNAEGFSFRADELTAVSNPTSSLSAPVETALATPAVQVASLADNAPQPAMGRKKLLELNLAQQKSGYEEKLYQAVEKAHKSNPDVTFILEGLYPVGSSKAQTQRQQQQAEKDVEKVLATLVDMGVPASRVTISVSAGSRTGTVVNLIEQ